MRNWLHIITPCSRPENLGQIMESLNFPCAWYVVCDGDREDPRFMKIREIAVQSSWISLTFVRGGVAGKKQINDAIDRIFDGWVYVLDDDNLMHPDFYKVVSDLTAKNPKVQGLFFSQELRTSIREVSPGTVRVNYIDQAQFVLKRELIGQRRYKQEYTADGQFIEVLYKDNDPALFEFYNDKPVTYYNKLR